MNRAPYDVVVVGLGLAGLVAGLAAASGGASVLLVGKGHGTLRFRTGTVDVLGYREGRQVESPSAELPSLAGREPPHPYALAPEDLPGLFQRQPSFGDGPRERLALNEGGGNEVAALVLA